MVMILVTLVRSWRLYWMWRCISVDEVGGKLSGTDSFLPFEVVAFLVPTRTYAYCDSSCQRGHVRSQVAINFGENFLPESFERLDGSTKLLLVQA